MKTTLNIPDDLYRRAKAEAALRGIPVTEMVTKGLRKCLQESSPEEKQKQIRFPLIRSKSRSKLKISEAQISDHETEIDASPYL